MQVALHWHHVPLALLVLVVDDVGGVVGLEDLAREGVGALRSGARVVEGGVPPLVRGVHVTAFRQEDIWKKDSRVLCQSRRCLKCSDLLLSKT